MDDGITMMTSGMAAVAAIRALKEERLEVRNLQAYHAQAGRNCNCSPQSDRFSN